MMKIIQRYPAGCRCPDPGSMHLSSRSLHLKWVELILPAIGAVLIWKCGVSPAYIVLAGIIGGLIYTFWIKGKMKQGNGE